MRVFLCVCARACLCVCLCLRVHERDKGAPSIRTRDLLDENEGLLKKLPVPRIGKEGARACVFVCAHVCVAFVFPWHAKLYMTTPPTHKHTYTHFHSIGLLRDGRPVHVRRVPNLPPRPHTVRLLPFPPSLPPSLPLCSLVRVCQAP